MNTADQNIYHQCKVLRVLASFAGVFWQIAHFWDTEIAANPGNSVKCLHNIHWKILPRDFLDKKGSYKFICIVGKRRQQSRSMRKLVTLSQPQSLKVTTEYRLSWFFVLIFFFFSWFLGENSPTHFHFLNYTGNELVQRVTSLDNELR